MGNRQSVLEEIDIYKPPTDDLQYKDAGNQFKIYQHKYKGYELMAHKVTLNEEKQLPLLIENFRARYQHHYLVSTLYLACEDYSACGGYYEAVIFYQRIFTNLSKIKDIPFQDVLHFYAVAFKGFQILYRRFGYFQLYEDMFHLGQDAKLKVWCNKDISKNEPQSYLIDKNGTEEDMIRKIIYIVSENTDPFTDRLNLRDLLFRYGMRNFQMANQSLREICRLYNLSVPERLLCISSLPSEEVKYMLDLYTSNSNYFGQSTELQQSTVPDLSENLNQPLPVPLSPYNSVTKIEHIPPIIHYTPVLTTPNYQRPQVPHTPITQHFSPHMPLNSQSNQQVSPLRHQNKGVQQSMIHTFNRRPQVPQVDHKRGIQLSMGENRERRQSWRPNKLMTESRNKFLPANNYYRNVTVQNNTPKFYSLQKKPDVKVNFVHNNAWSIQKPQGLNLSQRFNKVSYPQQVTLGQNATKNQNEVRQNYHVQQVPVVHVIPPVQTGSRVVEPSRSRVMYVQPPIQGPQYFSQPHSSPLPKIIYNPPSILNANNNCTTFYGKSPQQPGQFMKRSNHSVQLSTSNIQKSQSSQNHNHPNSKATYQPLYQQFRQRRASSKQKGTNQQSRDISQTTQYQAQQTNMSSQTLTKNASTPSLQKVEQSYYNTKPRQNPFDTVSNSFNMLKTPENRAGNPQRSHLQLEVPLNPSVRPQFDAHSASSRYLYSNKQLNDNIPDVKYKKASSPHKMISKLFDTKVQDLQSFNESKFGTQNSLKENSQVLEIIGREKKDSITSAFGEEDGLKKHDIVKQFTLESEKGYLKFDSAYKYGDSFTDPKILQILKRPSSKTLKNQLSTIKKVTKTSKTFDFSQQFYKRPTLSKEIKDDMLKLESWQTQAEKGQQFNSKNNLNNLQGFPSLSNLSEINKVQQNSFSDDKTNLVISNKKNLGRKSRFSEEKGGPKKEQNAVSDFYQFDYQSPTYQYSFSSKREVPIQDNEWRAKYGTTFSNSKNDSTTVHNKTNDYRVVPEKPFSYLTGFNSNESLASLQYELSQKLSGKNTKDKIKQSTGGFNQFSSETKSQHTEFTSASVSRRYNPKIDPEISRDLQRFKKQKQQIKNK